MGVDNKLNLVEAWGQGFGLYYSSCSFNQFDVQITSQGSNGWSPSGSATGSFVGIKSSSFHTYYALDVKSLQGSSLTSFAVEYSMDGYSYQTVDVFRLHKCVVGSVKTFYFKPVEARFIRIVVKNGTPNIKFQFYISSETAISQVEEQTT